MVAAPAPDPECERTVAPARPGTDLVELTPTRQSELDQIAEVPSPALEEGVRRAIVRFRHRRGRAPDTLEVDVALSERGVRSEDLGAMARDHAASLGRLVAGDLDRHVDVDRFVAEGERQVLRGGPHHRSARDGLHRRGRGAESGAALERVGVREEER